MFKLDTLFLDRDGVINVKLQNRYVEKPEEFKFISGAPEAISKLSKFFRRIIVVTNQQGIGKGIMTVEDLNFLHNYMLKELKKFGVVIDSIYFCPHLVQENCKCRKPEIGMLNQTLIDYPEINIEFSYLVGDSNSDIEAGKRFGLRTIRVNNTYTLAKWTESLADTL